MQQHEYARQTDGRDNSGGRISKAAQIYEESEYVLPINWHHGKDWPLHDEKNTLKFVA
jgi:alkyl hydroperoxide reductase subunit AhpC